MTHPEETKQPGGDLPSGFFIPAGSMLTTSPGNKVQKLC
jgi:hypothetical protein